MLFRKHTSTLSKHHLPAGLSRKCLDLNEKIAIMDHANKHPKMGCRKLAEHFSAEKQPVEIFRKTVKICEGTTNLSRKATKNVIMESIMYSP